MVVDADADDLEPSLMNLIRQTSLKSVWDRATRRGSSALRQLRELRRVDAHLPRGYSSTDSLRLLASFIDALWLAGGFGSAARAVSVSLPDNPHALQPSSVAAARAHRSAS
jgi:hypothetical protein